MELSPSSFTKVLACGVESIGNGAAEDLAAFFDVTPYEYILVLAQCSTIGTSTGLTVKFVSSDASSGTSPVTAKDAAGVDLSAALPAATPTLADGNTVMLQVRTRGLKKWGSPQLQAATGAMGVSYVVLGVGVRDTKEIDTAWTDEASEVSTESTSFAP
jgi:hypothetical protein